MGCFPFSFGSKTKETPEEKERRKFDKYVKKHKLLIAGRYQTQVACVFDGVAMKAHLDVNLWAGKKTIVTVIYFNITSAVFVRKGKCTIEIPKKSAAALYEEIKAFGNDKRNAQQFKRHLPKLLFCHHPGKTVDIDQIIKNVLYMDMNSMIAVGNVKKTVEYIKVDPFLAMWEFG